MNRLKTLGALAIVGALILMLSPAPLASASSQPAVLLSGTIAGNGYAAIKLGWTGPDALHLRITFPLSSGGSAMGIGYIRPDGTATSVTALSGWMVGNDDCVILESDATGTVSRSCHTSTARETLIPIHEGATSYLDGSISPETNDSPGIWTLFFWQAYPKGEELTASWELKAVSSEVHVLGTTVGDKALFASPSDFQGGAVAGVVQAGLFAEVNVASHLPFHIDHMLFGMMSADGAESKLPGMTVTGPVSETACFCGFLVPIPTPQNQAGDYDVALTRANAGTQANLQEGFVVVVDLDLPA